MSRKPGFKVTVEQRERMSAAQKALWAKRKAEGWKPTPEEQRKPQPKRIYTKRGGTVLPVAGEIPAKVPQNPYAGVTPCPRWRTSTKTPNVRYCGDGTLVCGVTDALNCHLAVKLSASPAMDRNAAYLQRFDGLMATLAQVIQVMKEIRPDLAAKCGGRR